MSNNINVTIFKGKSKKGNQFEALRVKVGDYEGLLFPTKIELLYIKNQLKNNAHEEFQDGLDVEDKD